MIYLQLVAGFIYLLMGGDLLVRGGVALARRARISPLVVAATVVAFGTSVPEIVVSVQAALSGAPAISLGNVVGSNIANVMLGCGVAALIYPLVASDQGERRDAAIMVVASVVFVIICLVVDLGRLVGTVLAAGLIAVVAHRLREVMTSRRQTELDSPIEWVLGLPSRLRMSVLFIVLGGIGLPVGAKLVVDSAVDIATRLGVGETVVGLTIVAVSTSLPELATTVVAATHRRTEMAIGAVIGSNIFNLLGVMGIAALVSPFPIEIPSMVLARDLPVMLAVTGFLAASVWRRVPIGRRAGIALIAGYVAYLVAMLLTH